MAALGESLRSAREALGVSLEQAAAATKIRKRYLVALEREDFANLPGGTYRRVFVRTYAAFLGLDVDAMTALLPQAAAVPATMERPAALARPPRAIATWLIAAVAVLALCGVLVALQLRRGDNAGAIAIAAIALNTPTVTIFATAPPTALPSPPPAADGAKPLEVLTKATDAVWLAVEVDGHQAFAGSLSKGDSRAWEGTAHVAIRTSDGGRLSASVNGTDKGILGKAGEALDAEWTLNAQGAAVQSIATPAPSGTAAPRGTPGPR